MRFKAVTLGICLSCGTNGFSAKGGSRTVVNSNLLVGNMPMPFGGIKDMRISAATSSENSQFDGSHELSASEALETSASSDQETQQSAWFASAPTLEPQESPITNTPQMEDPECLSAKPESIDTDADSKIKNDLADSMDIMDPPEQVTENNVKTGIGNAYVPVEEPVISGETNAGARDDIEEEIFFSENEKVKDIPVEGSDSETLEASANQDSHMSIKEILEVASEMEVLTNQIKYPQIVKSILPAPEPEPEPEPEPTKQPSVRTENDEKIEVFVKALGSAARDGTREIIKGLWTSLRRSAASALTNSMPENERVRLLERIQVPKQISTLEEVEVDEEETEKEDERGSVAEEIAAAQIEQVRLSGEKWETEKEELVKQMQDAANQRVESELEIQKKRMNKEMAAMKNVLESSQQQLVKDTQTLEERRGTKDEIAQLVEMGKQEVEELNGVLDKREQQKKDIANLETELRDRLKEIERKKELIAKGGQELDETIKENGVPHLSPKEYRSLSQEEKLALKELRQKGKKEVPVEEQTGEESKEEVNVHPILGSLVSDLGYKRIYLATSGKLGTIPIWKKQRIYRHGRAKSMAREKVKYMQLGFPGAVCLHEDKEGNLSVLDGQHRIGMMQLLREMKKEKGLPTGNDEYFKQVLVEVYPTPREGVYKDDAQHAEAVFLEINKAEPVKLVDMPGIASAQDRKIITDAVARMQEQFPKIFSPSQQCRVPNVNIDNLRNNIFGANVLRRHKLKSAKQLFDWLSVQNAALGASYECDAGRRQTISESAWKKASKNHFYLGLESSWLYN
jgi:hypothetical protein